ncbi:MAG: T9SS type A sorting domain-containing protein [Bacteroidia bacterium]|nr:T9SS type A sorting domain-containing protein [Bacteroidia bacterium]
MKKLLIIFLMLLARICSAQLNLVPNPSFEDTVSCPTSAFEISKADNWYSCRSTPDYFNICCNLYSGIVGVPNNVLGYQFPRTGNAYAGLIPYDINGLLGWEYIGTTLLTPTIIGQKYFVTFYISLADNTLFAINKFGIKLTMTPYSFNNPYPVNNSSLIYSDSIIIDTTGWSKIQLSFVADSNYQYLMLGNFFDYSLTDTVGSNRTFAYYYFDDICMSTDSVYCDNYTGLNHSTSNQPQTIIKNSYLKDDKLKVIFNDNYIEKEILIYSVSGQLLNTTKTMDQQIDIMLPGSSTIYFLCVYEKSKMESKKIIAIKNYIE